MLLVPRKNKTFNIAFEVSRSNIQDFGFSLNPNLTLRNVFHGAETLDIGIRTSIGSSKDAANPNNTFFNILEYGIDARLNFPKILFPLNTDSVIPKSMLPTTTINLGFAKQTNIGLDKENFIGGFTYNWFPKKNSIAKLDLFSLQYVNNINTKNYFNVYNSSYQALNNYAKTTTTNPSNLDSQGNLTITEGGVSNYISDVLEGRSTVNPNDDIYKKIRSIEERRRRLTENNLIFTTTFSFSETTKTTTNNDFHIFRTKLEAAGNLLSLFANISKELNAQNNKKTIFNIEYSQYLKSEIEYVKNWDLLKEKVFVVRGFVGIAIPYGNSTNIPFSRSYFAGGSNDNRGWQPYSLGPGKSASINDFNEANLKIALNSEFRFKIFNALKGALFVDAGNIWNALDDQTDKNAVFENVNSLKDIAVGSGFGLRYDLNFFVIRFDLGFKTYNPALEINNRWFKNYNFTQSVLNFGINYPF